MSKHLVFYGQDPDLQDATLIISFDGWLDGGDVSTGTVGWFIHELDAKKVASIRPDHFYLLNFPGTMEFAAMFRPHVRVENGRVKSLRFPKSNLYCDEKNNLLFFRGREPNCNWPTYAKCLFELCEHFHVKMICFVGSVAGVVPHTRTPRIHASASDDQMFELIEKSSMKLTNYEGPGGFHNYLLANASLHGLSMLSLIVEFSAYVQDRNPKAIAAVARKLSAILSLGIDVSELRQMGDQWERRVTRVVKEKQELFEYIKKLEEDYDNEVFDTQMGDLRAWLETQGVRLE